MTLTNVDVSSGTLSKGYVTDFNDVPQNQTFHAFVTTLVSNGITAGVGGGNYGVASSTLRQQMAVFLLKAKYGVCYVPPPCTPGFFADVPCPGTLRAVDRGPRQPRASRAAAAAATTAPPVPCAATRWPSSC